MWFVGSSGTICHPKKAGCLLLHAFRCTLLQVHSASHLTSLPHSSRLPWFPVHFLQSYCISPELTLWRDFPCIPAGMCPGLGPVPSQAVCCSTSHLQHQPCAQGPEAAGQLHQHQQQCSSSTSRQLFQCFQGCCATAAVHRCHLSWAGYTAEEVAWGE